jgi:hypothetical protein
MQWHPTRMPDKEEDQRIDQIAKLIAVGIDREAARSGSGLAVRRNRDSISVYCKSMAFYVMLICKFVIYAVREKRDMNRRHIFGRTCVCPIRVQRKRNFEGVLVI